MFNQTTVRFTVGFTEYICAYTGTTLLNTWMLSISGPFAAKYRDKVAGNQRVDKMKLAREMS